MAWRIHRSVVRGEIDNRRPGIITGTFWLAGVPEPIELALRGNCLKDLAGCRLTFTNPAPIKCSDLLLHPIQDGHAGDMTASRKVRIPQVDNDKLKVLIRENQPIPVSLGNCLYLEWFSEVNGRVVIESADYHCQISPAEWRMSPEEEDDQLRHNEEELQKFLQKLVNQQTLCDLDDETAQPMDEFQWERLLRESDEMTERYLEALEKYRDDPDRDRLLAEEMGWEWLQENTSVNEEDLSSDDEEELDIIFEPEAPEHPLAKAARSLATHLFKMVEKSAIGQIKDARESATVTKLLVAASDLSGKLAAALNCFEEPDEFEGGFIVASLKRSLTPLNQAVAHSESLAASHPEHDDWLLEARDTLFQIREEILTLMEEFRQRNRNPGDGDG